MSGVYSGPGNPTHGIASTYRSPKYACRCGPCRDANTALKVKQNESRRERLAADPSLVNHGSASTYINWGCRCEPCTAAMAAKNKAQRIEAAEDRADQVAFDLMREA